MMAQTPTLEFMLLGFMLLSSEIFLCAVIFSCGAPEIPCLKLRAHNFKCITDIIGFLSHIFQDSEQMVIYQGQIVSGNMQIISISELRKTNSEITQHHMNLIRDAI